ncbi:MAG: hypothetical protein ABI703_07445 [Gemmatimonadales bacterium]
MPGYRLHVCADRPGRLALLATLTLAACGGEGTTPSGPPPAVRGTYDVSGQSTNDLLSQFTFAGTLVLSQPGDPPGGVIEGTLTLTYSRPGWSSAPAPILSGSATGDSIVSFIAGPASGSAVWRGRFTGAAIVNGRFGCDGCYEGVWGGTRR